MSEKQITLHGDRINGKLKFNCVKCDKITDAPTNTKRADKKLCRECYGKRKDTRVNELNDLIGKEWASLSRSVESYPGIRTERQRKHGACFPVSLAEQQIRIYTKSGNLVLDPFMGVGTTAEAAKNLGRKSIGIEINEKFVKLAREDLKRSKDHKLICGDVKNILKYVKPNSVDFLLTSPPYGNLLKTVKGAFAYKWQEHSTLNKVKNPEPYSNSKKDLGNLPYNEFFIEIEKVFKDTYVTLKSNAYAVWVVKDYRDLKNDVPLVNFHSDIISVAKKVGFILWDIKIYDQTKFRPLVVLGYPSKNYYLNIGHSYLLIFRKFIKGKNANKTDAKKNRKSKSSRKYKT
ncbi:site-specific DNA-methyltransferase [Candidatus Woesearchaeota archaeon]|nr:site-specific DNA-methyltransferase [Candidatus Woesearchaeota archaeon]